MKIRTEELSCKPRSNNASSAINKAFRMTGYKIQSTNNAYGFTNYRNLRRYNIDSFNTRSLECAGAYPVQSMNKKKQVVETTCESHEKTSRDSFQKTGEAAP